MKTILDEALGLIKKTLKIYFCFKMFWSLICENRELQKSTSQTELIASSFLSKKMPLEAITNKTLQILLQLLLLLDNFTFAFVLLS